MAKDTAKQAELEQEIVSFVQSNYSTWEDPVAFVTTKIAFQVRNLIETLRKNYYGIFDNPTDNNTGRDKVWIPLTESVVDTVVKNIDLDTKDINFRAKNANAVQLTSFVRNVVRESLDQMSFGDKLDELERYMSVDGTAVWKTYVTNEKGKKVVRVKLVDLLNFFIDPTANSIQEASGVLERGVMTTDEMQRMDGWKNTDGIEGGNFSRNQSELNAAAFVADDQDNLVEVFEYWGLMPKEFITGKEKDSDEMIEGHIVFSGMNKDQRVHLVEENTNKDSTGRVIKPYEEVRYMRVPGRWHGRGPAEKLMMLQTYLNTIVNIRINRSYVTQLGLFKIRKGSGVTAQMISKLPTTGAVVLNDINDLQQMVMQDASEASYRDEENINNWAQRITSAYESVTGEQLPSSTSATSAVIQNRMAQSQFVMVRETVGLFLQRWLKNHFMPKLAETISKGDIVRMMGETEEFEKFDANIANTLVKQKVDEMLAQGVVPTPEQVAAELNRVKDQMRTLGPQRFIEVMKKPDMSDFDVQVYVTNEEIDKGVLVQNLLSVLSTVSQVPDIGVDPKNVVKQIFDVMGLDVGSFASSVVAPPAAPQGVSVQATDQNVPSDEPQTNKEAQTLQQLTTAANTM